jgi:hypothetical protein
MNEILTYASINRRRVSIGYKTPDGKLQRMFSKIDGTDGEAIRDAIAEVSRHGVKEILVEVYHPNGSALIIGRTFSIPNNDQLKSTLGNVDQFNSTLGNIDQTRTIQSSPRPYSPSNSTRVNTTSSNDSWKDYALKTEQEKVSRLESEYRRLVAENKTLDNKVRDFEKEMIKKDHEVEKLTQAIENKSGLNGFVEKAAESPHVMTLLAGMASRMMGIPMDQLHGQPAVSGSPELTQAQTEQYLANIRSWLYKQPDDLQEVFYQLVYHLTNVKDVKGTALQLINVLKGNPMTGTHN